MRRAAVLSILTLLLASPLSGCLGGDSRGQDTGLLPPPDDASGDDSAAAAPPEWSFVATDGETYARDSPEGNATMLFFMATWCSTCRGMAPMVSSVHESFAPQGLRTYSVSVDATSREEQSLDSYDWKESANQDWPHGIDRGQTMMRTFGIFQQSSLVVLDGEGHVVQKWGYGRATEEEVRAAVEEALRRSAGAEGPADDPALA